MNLKKEWVCTYAEIVSTNMETGRISNGEKGSKSEENLIELITFKIPHNNMIMVYSSPDNLNPLYIS